MVAEHQEVDPYFSAKCAVASFLANYVVGVFHPLEVLKTRFQSHDGNHRDNLVPKYQGIIKGVSDIYKTEGLSGLFKGLHLATFTAAVANAIFFWIYQKQKMKYQQHDNSLMTSTGIASIEAGVLTTILTQPFWVIKTRVLLNTDPKISEIYNIKVKSQQIWRHHGISGFYLGLGMNLLLSLTGAVQMYVYEQSKVLYDSFIPNQVLGQKNFVCGAISRLASTVVSYPLTTIRTRAQQTQYISSSTQKKYKNSWDITTRIIREQGIYGFFKGLTPNLLRGIPHRGVYFYFYEIFKVMMINNPSAIAMAN